MANPKGNPQNLKPFQPGASPNPGGKPKGARDRVTKRFLLELAEDFEAAAKDGVSNGRRAIEAMRENHPEKYVMAVVALLPKEIDVNASILDNFTPDDLVELLAKLDRALNSEGSQGEVSAEVLASVAMQGRA